MSPKKKEKIDIEKAKEVIAEAQKEAASKCHEEINEVLERYGFAIQLTQPQMMLVPRAKE